MSTSSRRQSLLVRGMAVSFGIVAGTASEAGRYPRYAWLAVAVGGAVAIWFAVGFYRALRDSEGNAEADPKTELRKDTMTALVLSTFAARVADTPQHVLRIACFVLLAMGGCGLLFLMLARRSKRS